MGFFDKFFGSERPSDAPPMTEMTLDAQSAAAVLAEIDIDTAITAHENWKLRLQQYLKGESDDVLDPATVCMDDRCALGQWLHGPGGQRLGKYPAFSVLVARHQYFHQQAADVVTQVQAGDRTKATQTLNSSYRYASSQVILLLKDLKRGLSR